MTCWAHMLAGCTQVCARLGLVSLTYMWHQPQEALLRGMIASGIKAVLIKVAALGLVPERHLGRTLQHMEPHLHKICRSGLSAPAPHSLCKRAGQHIRNGAILISRAAILSIHLAYLDKDGCGAGGECAWVQALRV